MSAHQNDPPAPETLPDWLSTNTGPVRYTYGRQGLRLKRKGTPSHPSTQSRSSHPSKKQRTSTRKSTAGSASSNASANSGNSGGHFTTTREQGDRMILWWTSYVSNADRVRMELEERIEHLERLVESLRTQLESGKRDAAQQLRAATSQRDEAVLAFESVKERVRELVEAQAAGGDAAIVGGGVGAGSDGDGHSVSVVDSESGGGSGVASLTSSTQAAENVSQHPFSSLSSLSSASSASASSASSASASASASPSLASQLQRAAAELSAKDALIASLGAELRREAKEHADLKLRSMLAASSHDDTKMMMMQYDF